MSSAPLARASAALSLFTLIGLISPLAAGQPVNYGNTKVTHVTDIRTDTPHGYTEFRFLISNLGDRTRRLTLEMPFASYGGRGSGGVRSLTRTFDIDPTPEARPFLAT